MYTYSVVVLSAGMGKRMGLGFNKMLFELEGQPILFHTLNVFINDSKCSEIIVVINPEDEGIIDTILTTLNSPIIKKTFGGKERQDSVYNGLNEVTNEIVLIHDGARPFITQQRIDQLLNSIQTFGNGILAVPTKDTVKIVLNHQIQSTPKRETIYNAQTPQGFLTKEIRKCHELARMESYLGTDDAELMEKYSKQVVHIVEGDYTNIKITTKEDLILAKHLLNKE